mgnify:FL=1
MEMNFCRRCGTQLIKKSINVYVCKNEHKLYVNPDPAVNVFFVTDDNHVLLSVRAFEPYKGMIDSFGGFIDTNETAEQALEREVMEETGLTSDSYSTPQYLCTAIAPYPFGGEIRDTMSLYFWSQVHRNAKLTPADDVASIVKVPLYATKTADMEQIKVIEPFLKLRDVLSDI